jgi:hypothetical protein
MKRRLNSLASVHRCHTLPHRFRGRYHSRQGCVLVGSCLLVGVIVVEHFVLSPGNNHL